MTKSSLRTINFQGILLQKTVDVTYDDVHMIFKTRSGTKTIIAHNPLLTPRLQIGVTYDIKGHERDPDDETRVRLMSAWPVIEPESAWIPGSRKVVGSGVFLVLLAVLAVVSLLPSSVAVSIKEVKPYADLAEKERKDTIQTPVADIAGSLPFVLPQAVADSYVEPMIQPMVQPVASESITPPLVIEENQVEQAAPSPYVAPHASSWDIQKNEISSSNVDTSDVQPSATLQPSDASLRPVLESASS